jgi:hypothetical protein
VKEFPVRASAAIERRGLPRAALKGSRKVMGILFSMNSRRFGK